MHSDISLARIKTFPLLMWIMLIGAFFTRGSYYMVWPFLAVMLYQTFNLSATEVGMVLSFAAVVSVGFSFVGGALSDFIGRNKLMYFSGLLYIVSFSLLAQAQTVTEYVAVITLCSIATSLWRPLTSALIGDIIEDSKTRELAMQLLYFIINVGCAIGPMIGLWLGITGEQQGFYITAAAFAVLLVFLAWGFHQHGPLPTANSHDDHNDQEKTNSVPKQRVWQVLRQDKLLHALVVANIICMFVYAQMDSSLIQYLTRAEVPNLLELISTLIFTNAMVIITCQFVLLGLMARLSLIQRIQIGLVLLMASQVWFGANPLDVYWGWIGATVLMSLAEAILFPTMNVHIDRLAPNKLRGAYFGASSFYEVGFALAPLGGGIILDHLGGPALFYIGAVLTLFVMYLYATLERRPRPDFSEFN